jgi:hypothetical protein
MKDGTEKFKMFKKPISSDLLRVMNIRASFRKCGMKRRPCLISPLPWEALEIQIYLSMFSLPLGWGQQSYL